MPKNFFGELKRRNVYKIAVAYAMVGWLVIQVATQVFPFLAIPIWVVRLVIVLVALGFPIALVIAWAFERTPEGIKRTENVGPALRIGVRRIAPGSMSFWSEPRFLDWFVLCRSAYGDTTRRPRTRDARHRFIPARKIDRGVAVRIAERR